VQHVCNVLTRILHQSVGGSSKPCHRWAGGRSPESQPNTPGIPHAVGLASENPSRRCLSGLGWSFATTPGGLTPTAWPLRGLGTAQQKPEAKRVAKWLVNPKFSTGQVDRAWTTYGRSPRLPPMRPLVRSEQAVGELVLESRDCLLRQAGCCEH